MSKDLVLVKANKQLVQYKAMCKAIDVCHGFDECKDIIDKSVAMAAYYQQIKDTETELMFYRVRLRAWRRIGELFSGVDLSKCETQTAKIKKLRAAFPRDPTVIGISDHYMAHIIKLMRLSNADFEHALKHPKITGSLADLLLRTPEAQAAYAAARKRSEQIYADREKVEREETEKNRAIISAKMKVDALERKHEAELDRAAATAMNDIGFTLERLDRANMRKVLFLIKQEVHEVMRQAAFDKRITMQEVLRRGLKLWLEANGYDWPDDDPAMLRPSHHEDATV